MSDEEDTWDGPEDARQRKGAGEYPNYYSHKTRSGHLFMMDDSKGQEHVTMQHRSGSLIQFLSDGGVQYVSHNKQWNIIFGDNKVVISGDQTITIQGGAKLKVDGDYDLTIGGKMNLDVTGDLNINAQNINQNARGNVDTQAKNKTEKIEGSSTSQSHGSTTIVSQGGMTLGSSAGALALGAAQQIGIVAQGKVLAKGSEVHLKSDGEMRLLTGKKLSLRGKGVGIDAAPVLIEQNFAGYAEDGESSFVHSPAKVSTQDPNSNVG